MRHFVIAAFLLFSAAFTNSQQVAPSDQSLSPQYQAGRSALDAGKNQDAIDLFKQANKTAQNRCAECDLGMAVAYTRMARLSDAIDSCNRAIAAATNDETRATAHMLKGKALLSVDPGPAGEYNKQIPQAEEEFRAAITILPRDPIARLNLATALLRQNKDEAAKAELEQCLALHPSPTVAEKAQSLLDNPRRGREAVAPNFALTTLQGDSVSLKQLSGKIVVLDFWATWCPPCRASVGELKELKKKYPNTVELISISADEKESQWRDFVSQKKMNWPQYIDSDGHVRNSFQVHSFPTYIVIDGEGFVKQRITGLNPQETVVYRLKEILAQMPQPSGEAVGRK
jgi:thiol-disulfide isomerase/thioredoxin